MTIEHLVEILNTLSSADPALPIDRTRARVGDDPRIDFLVEVMKTVRADHADNALRSTVETWLDAVFDGEFKTGAEFEHTEAIMAALTAMTKADAAAAIPLLFVFSRSKSAELGLLRRFSTNLLLEHGGFPDVEDPQPSVAEPTVDSPLFKVHHIFLTLPAMPDWQISHVEIYEYAVSKHISPIVRIYFEGGLFSRFDKDRGQFLDPHVIGPLDKQMEGASGQIINMLIETLHRIWPRSEASTAIRPPCSLRSCLQIVDDNDNHCPNPATHEGLLDLDGDVCWTLFCADHAAEGAIPYSGQSRLHL